MNSKDYKYAMKDIKPSKALNDKTVANIINKKKYTRVSEKKSYRSRIVFASILFLSISSASVAASTWNLSDIFKGHVKELSSKENDNRTTDNQNTNSVSDNSDFLKSAGTILEATDKKDGLKLTARGVVGDDRVLYIAIDVETENGKPFTKEEEKKLNSIHFREVKLQLDNDVLGQYCSCTRIDDGSKKGKATFLINDIIKSNNIDNISGHHMKITFTDFMEESDKLEDIGMEGNLYDIFTKFKTPNDEDYDFYSVRGNSNHTKEENEILDEYWKQRKSGKLSGEAFIKRRDELIEAGLLEPLYLLPKTSTKINFCKKYPKLAITNMGIKNNILTFNMDINDELDYKYINSKRLVLMNRKSGAQVGTTMDIDEWKGDENGKLLSAHFVVFHTITSPDQLKDYYLAIGGEDSQDIIKEGKWVLDFDLSYKDTTRSYALNQKADISGYTGVIKSVDISPLSAKIEFQLDKSVVDNDKSQQSSDQNYAASTESGQISLILKDGNKLTNLTTSANYENGSCTYHVMFPYIISLDQIKGISLDHNEINLN